MSQLPPAPGPGPIRLRVAYKSPASLLSELTRSVGRGPVLLESRRPLPPGAQFVFEMHAHGVGAPVEVVGEVVHSGRLPDRPGYWLEVRYVAGADRRGLDAVLRRIFEAHQHDKQRKHPRIPIHLRASEAAPVPPAAHQPPGAALAPAPAPARTLAPTEASPSPVVYVVKDISRGGCGVEVEAPAPTPAVRVGTPFLLELPLWPQPALLHGEVVWVTQAPPGRSRWVNPAFGVQFGKLRPDAAERLENLLELRDLPPPPWWARVSFGMDAVSRMP